ncbi:MAG: Asp-tRNA(Asn)/Glu-tRNA(Gln) amidotransferase subunit GatB [Candidatus Omnitrophica bacterium]|nr:Asp-tRNA(Asn)/Glu-tRNA(Gln) amidotransferase subunit GatB [Candidatus Omnitrophota bacterium]
MNYQPVIGLEVHLHLKTKSKAFCGCSTEFGKEPNSQVCPVCLGFPGSLPVLNQTAFFYAVKTGLALNCSIAEFTKFDRKNYYYPDLPKNYQISQYDMPIASEGFLDIESEGKPKRVGIIRVHLEEDAGKLIHRDDSSCVDFNRAGIPLLEIVTKPEINSPLEAYEYLTLLKSTLEYLDVSDCDMEKGSLRCDANVSVRKKSETTLGTKTELKNMNSFKGVRDALAYEIDRQIEVLGSGGKLIQETRLWDPQKLKTHPMRSKEEAMDYRYFPEPDLPPFVIAKDKCAQIKREIPELPRQKVLRFMKEYNLSAYDARVLASSKSNALYAEECLVNYSGKDKKQIVNWLTGALLSQARSRNCPLSGLKVTPSDLIKLVGFVEKQQVSALSAKTVLAQMISTGRAPEEIIKEKNLSQICDESSLEAFIEEAIKENPKSVKDYQQGKQNALMFLVGQTMKKSKGKANPKVVQELLKRRI